MRFVELLPSRFGLIAKFAGEIGHPFFAEFAEALYMPPDHPGIFVVLFQVIECGDVVVGGDR